jgi:hypothetical protein
VLALMAARLAASKVRCVEHLLTLPNLLSLVGMVTWLSGSKLVSDGNLLGWWLSVVSLIPAAVLACMAGAPVGLLGTAVGAYLTVRAIKKWSLDSGDSGRARRRSQGFGALRHGNGRQSGLTGGPGLWVARETGASLIGIDFSQVGIEHAQQRADELGLSEHAVFLVRDVEMTRLPEADLDGSMSVDRGGRFFTSW